jgi:hypothetical protein
MNERRIKKLEYLVQFHADMAEMFAGRKEASMARQFKDLANERQDELERLQSAERGIVGEP